MMQDNSHEYIVGAFNSKYIVAQLSMHLSYRVLQYIPDATTPLQNLDRASIAALL